MSRYSIAIIKLLSKEDYKPLSASEIRKALGISKKHKSRFYQELRKLKKAGKVKKISKSRYIITKKQPKTVLKGQLIKREGIYFLQTQTGEVRLPRLINALHASEGDEVAIKIEKGKVGISSKVTKIIKRRTKNVIGYLVKLPKGWIVSPADRKIPFVVSIKGSKDLKEGWLVYAKITAPSERKNTLKGEIVKVYGDPFNPAIDRDVVIDKFNLPHIFSDEIEEELKLIKQPEDKDFEDRIDYRSFPTITIDGEDAKDFDDAVDIQQTENGFKLFVHIADVSHYVKEGSKLDQEALKRGFSVYFPDSVIPMLPFKLSNDICSLVPDKDRLTVSVEMDISKTGAIKRYRIAKSVIQNKNRMTYNQVQAIIDGRQKAEESLYQNLKTMEKLAKILRRRRFKKGSLDLDIPEAHFIVKDGEIIDIQEREHLFSHSIIEEFMLAANLCVADFLKNHYPVFIRRVHDEPDEAKIAILIAFLRKMGIKFDLPDEFTSKQLQKLLSSIKDEKTKKIVSQLLLRSLKRAEYSTAEKGHFALNFKNYTHFTSPIRRYPDLVVHRMVKAKLEKANREFDNLEEIATEVKNREIITENAMFYMNDIKTAQFMKPRIGEIFNATITTIIPNGFFVRLKEHFVEGFVPASQLKDDYYHYIEHMYAMVGKRTRKMYRLGDDVRVMAINVDKFAGEVDFTIV
ncbi:ribonuclease R [Hippea jasoniae]|uniref:ribonuclease R n=1 Tax=Hippea jasoniae TaxID=944479 RepID=UPI00068BF192|nr:ribonuclease R [Hippea jasoniae]